jgi:hypothetical protein
MRKFMYFFFFLLSVNLYSKNYDNFKVSDISSINEFTYDISKVLTSGSINSARVLGFGGFALSYKSVYGIKPGNGDSVYEKNRVYRLDFVQVEIGLPYRIDTYLRAGGEGNFNAIGFGLRYGLKNVVDEIYKPNLILGLGSNIGLQKYFYIVNYNAQIALSLKITNVIRPFASAGFSYSELNIKNNDDITLVGKNIYKNFPFYTLGLRFKFKWFNISMAYDIYEKEDGFNTSVGVRF